MFQQGQHGGRVAALPQALEESFREAVLTGLSATPKSVPSKWIYDERGSRLFEAVCEAPEYYPTRTEVSLMEAHVDEIATLAGPDCALVEFGCGASHKVRLLLDALARPTVYVPVDIDGETLRRTAESIAADYPETAVVAAVLTGSGVRSGANISSSVDLISWTRTNSQ